MKIRARENSGVDYEDKAMRRSKEWIMMSWSKLFIGYRLATHKDQYSLKCDPSEISGMLTKSASCRLTLQNYLTKSLRVGYVFLTGSHMILM